MQTTPYDLAKREWERKRRERRRLLWNTCLYTLFVPACLLAGVLLPQSASAGVSLVLTCVVAWCHR